MGMDSVLASCVETPAHALYSFEEMYSELEMNLGSHDQKVSHAWVDLCQPLQFLARRVLLHGTGVSKLDFAELSDLTLHQGPSIVHDPFL